MQKTKAPTNIFKDAIRKVVHEELLPVEFKLDTNTLKLDDLESKIDNLESKSDERHDLVMRTLDKIVGMFKNHDEEHTMLGANHKRVLDLEDKVEKLQSIHPNYGH